MSQCMFFIDKRIKVISATQYHLLYPQVYALDTIQVSSFYYGHRSVPNKFKSKTYTIMTSKNEQ